MWWSIIIVPIQNIAIWACIFFLIIMFTIKIAMHWACIPHVLKIFRHTHRRQTSIAPDSANRFKAFRRALRASPYILAPSDPMTPLRMRRKVLKGDSEPPRSGLFESGWMDWFFQGETYGGNHDSSYPGSQRIQPILGPLGCLKYSVKGMCSNMMSSTKATTNLFCAAYIEFPCATFGAEILSF